MRVGIDCRMIGRENATGIGNYIYQLISHYSQLSSDIQFVLFIKSGNNVTKNLPNNFIFVECDIHWYGWAEQLILPWIIYMQKLDLMHFPHWNVPILYLKKYIVTIHDLIPLKFPGHKMRSKIKRLLQRFVIANALNNSDIIITISNYTKSLILKEFHVDEEKIKIIYQGVEKDFGLMPENAKINATLERFGITKPFWLYVGVQRNHKNILGLIKAFEISSKNSDAQLVIGGVKNQNYQELENYLQNLPTNISSKIIRTGFLSNDELNCFYHSARVYVVPSFEEGFGLNGLEAMSAHLPVASSNSASLPEIYEDAAKYFDPKNPEEMAKVVDLVCTNEILRRELITKGIKNSQSFSWESTAKNTLELYSCQKPKNPLRKQTDQSLRKNQS